MWTIIIAIIILASIIFLVVARIKYIKYLKTKELQDEQNVETVQSNSERPKFQSNLSSISFPDRVDAIVWHIKAIERAIASFDLNFANLSYAKLIESIRQQSINEPRKYDDSLKIIQNEYAEFRRTYGVKYPEQFLPPEERKENVHQTDNILVYLQTLNYYELPKSILKHIDIVKTINQWNELGFKPKKDEFGSWNSIKRQEKYFEFVSASINNHSHKISLETGKRITSNPTHIKTLIEQGCSLDEFINISEDLKYFFNAIDFFNKKNYNQSMIEINKAIIIKSLKDYTELKDEISIKLGDESVAEDKFKKFENDIDSPIHTREIFDWLKIIILNKDFVKAKNYIEKINETLDKLAKGLIQPKIYGKQSSGWYIGKKDDFNNNLNKSFDFDVMLQNQSEDAIKLLGLFVFQYSGKDINPIETVADIYVKWDIIDKAKILYSLCLERLSNIDKPRVIARLNKKLSELEKKD